MKMKIVLTAIFTLICAAAAVSAQDKAADYSGKWNLDVSKSKFDERARIESMTLTVSQTATELKVESATKRAARPEGDQQGNGGGMPNNGGRGMVGARRGGGMGGGMGDGTTVYALDGKETSSDIAAGGTNGKATLKAKAEKDGKLKLTQTRDFETQMGAITVKTTENWSLSADGKTLTVKRDSETPRGTSSSEMVFTKQ